MKNYKDIYNNIISSMKAKNTSGIELVEKAFNLAESKHAGQKRKSGDDYVLHPIEVAEILEKYDFDSNVISAGLLHDVVEDCEYTIKEIETNFNEEVAFLVDSVTAIEKEDLDVIKDEKLIADENIKFILDDMTYQKLIKYGKVNRKAFFIKFADRLNNLQTISCFPKFKQIEKVRETIKWIVPLLKIFKAQKFLNEILNECFLIVNEERLSKTNFLNLYNNKLEQDMINSEDVKIALTKSLEEQFENFLRIEKDCLTPLEIINYITNECDVDVVNNINEDHFKNTPIYSLQLIFNNSLTSIQCYELIKSFIENSFNSLKIEYVQKNKYLNSYSIIVEDLQNTRYILNIFNENDFIKFKNGNYNNINLDFLTDDVREITTKFIKVKTTNNQTIYLPDGSTVLDLAFKLDSTMAYSLKGAYLNGSTKKSPIFFRLLDGDIVELEFEKNENDNFVKTAKLEWITYCKTDYAKNMLITLFENN